MIIIPYIVPEVVVVVAVVVAVVVTSRGMSGIKEFSSINNSINHT